MLVNMFYMIIMLLNDAFNIYIFGVYQHTITQYNRNKLQMIILDDLYEMQRTHYLNFHKKVRDPQFLLSLLIFII